MVINSKEVLDSISQKPRKLNILTFININSFSFNMRFRKNNIKILCTLSIVIVVVLVNEDEL